MRLAPIYGSRSKIPLGQSITGVTLKLAAVMLWDDGLKEVWNGRNQGEQGDTMFLSARPDA
ncbi:MAG TPA: hypothetical protein VH933_00130 [Aestuariivirgaceae bacterium]|jgi:hypothetical protein